MLDLDRDPHSNTHSRLNYGTRKEFTLICAIFRVSFPGEHQPSVQARGDEPRARGLLL